MIIPVFNGERYIHRAVTSALIQNPSPSEVVVVDDGSTDKSAEVVRAIQDPRIRIVFQVNAGVGAARNRGAAVATGNFLCFLDADDEWLPGFLSVICQLLEKFPDCGLYSTAYGIMEPGERYWFPTLKEFPDPAWVGRLPDFFQTSLKIYPFNSSSVVIPIEVYRAVGGFAEGFLRGQDLDLWVRLALSYPIAFAACPMAIYHRDAEGRVSLKYRHLGEKLLVSRIRKFIAQGNISPDRERILHEYIAKHQIEAASQCVVSGRSETARQLLATCRDTKLFLLEWRRWNRWAFLPGWMTLLLLWTRNFFRQLTGSTKKLRKSMKS